MRKKINAATLVPGASGTWCVSIYTRTHVHTPLSSSVGVVTAKYWCGGCRYAAPGATPRYADKATETGYALKLAYRAFFCQSIMQQCSVMGERGRLGLPQAELSTLKKVIFSK